MAPPLPEASQPSNTTQQRRAELLRADLAAEQQPQVDQPLLGRGQVLLVLLLAQVQRQIDLVQTAHGVQRGIGS